jgi:hypothetical protein
MAEPIKKSEKYFIIMMKSNGLGIKTKYRYF